MSRILICFISIDRIISLKWKKKQQQQDKYLKLTRLNNRRREKKNVCYLLFYSQIKLKNLYFPFDFIIIHIIYTTKLIIIKTANIFKINLYFSYIHEIKINYSYLYICIKNLFYICLILYLHYLKWPLFIILNNIKDTYLFFYYKNNNNNKRKWN